MPPEIRFGLMTLLATAAFTKALGTRNSFTSGPQDCNNKFWAAGEIYGHGAIHPIPDLDSCDLTVILGMNPMVSKGSFMFLPNAMQKIRAIEKRGGQIWWVDPRRTESVRTCGRHLPIRPGTDHVLLIWLLHEIAATPRWGAAVKTTPSLSELEKALPSMSIEQAEQITGLSRPELQAFRDAVLNARKPILHMSVGVNFGPFGSLSYVVLHAVMLALGNVDREGGWLDHDRWLVRAQAVLPRLLGRGEGRGRALKVSSPTHEGRPHRASQHRDRVLHLFTPSIRAEVERFGRWLTETRSDSVASEPLDGWMPLRVIGRRRSLMYNSWHGADGPGGGEGAALLHPSTASHLSLLPGQPVELRRNGLGVLRIPWQATEDIPKDVISVPHGLAGVNVNSIIPSGSAAVEPFSGQHIMSAIPVSARRACS